MAKDFYIDTNNGEVIVTGVLDSRNFKFLLGAIHSRAKAGFQDVDIDFSGLTRCGPTSMIAICAIIDRYKREGYCFYCKLPEDDKLKKLFKNSNWAFFINSEEYSQSAYKGHTQIPAKNFKNDVEQNDTVNAIVDSVLASCADFKRDHFRAIEWSINEITDNVINHSESKGGGFAQITHFSRKKTLHFTVADAGLSIPKTLRSSKKEIANDVEALDLAIREGVTRDSSIGQGNGLFGCWRLAVEAGGELEIHSGHASVIYSPNSGLHSRREKVPFTGTLVSLKLPYDKPLDIMSALQFRGVPHRPVDYVEVKYEVDVEGNIIFKMIDESRSFGSRQAAIPVRTKLENLLNMNVGTTILVDLSGIPIMSSSYADEVFGKLFINIGPLSFTQRIKFIKIDSLIKKLLDRAILQRSQTGL